MNFALGVVFGACFFKTIDLVSRTYVKPIEIFIDENVGTTKYNTRKIAKPFKIYRVSNYDPSFERDPQRGWNESNFDLKNYSFSVVYIKEDEIYSLEDQTCFGIDKSKNLIKLRSKSDKILIYEDEIRLMRDRCPKDLKTDELLEYYQDYPLNESPDDDILTGLVYY